MKLIKIITLIFTPLLLLGVCFNVLNVFGFNFGISMSQMWLEFGIFYIGSILFAIISFKIAFWIAGLAKIQKFRLLKIVGIFVFILTLLIGMSSCSTVRDCNGRAKERVPMGYK